MGQIVHVYRAGDGVRCARALELDLYSVALRKPSIYKICLSSHQHLTWKSIAINHLQEFFRPPNAGVTLVTSRQPQNGLMSQHPTSLRNRWS